MMENNLFRFMVALAILQTAAACFFGDGGESYRKSVADDDTDTSSQDIPTMSGVAQERAPSGVPELYTIDWSASIAGIKDCNPIQPTLMGCYRIKINPDALGADRIAVRDFKGKVFTMPKKFGNLTPGSSEYQSASYESWEPNYMTATLTFKNTGANIYTVAASLSVHDDDKEGGEYRIASCFNSGGIGCHILQRLDRTKFGDM